MVFLLTSFQNKSLLKLNPACFPLRTPHNKQTLTKARDDKRYAMAVCNSARTRCKSMLLVLAFLIICPKSDAFQQISPSSHVRGVDQNAEGPMRRVSALDMATWSNGQAIKEYQGKFTLKHRMFLSALLTIITPSISLACTVHFFVYAFYRLPQLRYV